MKIPKTYEEFLKTPDKDLMKLAESEKTIEEAHQLMIFVLKAVDDFAEKDKIITEEKRNSAKSLWERYCE